MQLLSTHSLLDRHYFLWCWHTSLLPLCISRCKVSAWSRWMKGGIAPSPLPPLIICCKESDIAGNGFFLLAAGWSLWGHFGLWAASLCTLFSNPVSHKNLLKVMWVYKYSGWWLIITLQTAFGQAARVWWEEGYCSWGVYSPGTMGITLHADSCARKNSFYTQ